MIIWWTGKGLLAFPIMLGAFLIPFIGAVEFITLYPNTCFSPFIVFLAMAIGWGAGGYICLKLGRKWNQNVPMGQFHTLYSIRVENWGKICLVFASLAVVMPIVLLIAAAIINLVKHHHL
jgi:hypothetical protein